MHFGGKCCKWLGFSNPPPQAVEILSLVASTIEDQVHDDPVHVILQSQVGTVGCWSTHVSADACSDEHSRQS
jgi:hypothetical protein